MALNILKTLICMRSLHKLHEMNNVTVTSVVISIVINEISGITYD
jgi:hypothetical protein